MRANPGKTEMITLPPSFQVKVKKGRTPEVRDGTETRLEPFELTQRRSEGVFLSQAP